MPEVRFHHIPLACPDSYTRHFGFVRPRVIALGEGQIAFIRNREMYLELFQATAAGPIVEAKLAAMGADANVVVGPLDFDTFIPGWRSVWLRDPAGDLVQITQGFTDQTDPPPLPPA